MNCYFISDDRYFLAGMESILDEQNPHYCAKYINVNDNLNEFVPSSDDVVVLYMSAYKMFRTVMKYLNLIGSRLIIMLRMNISRQDFKGINPMLIPWNTSPPELNNIIYKVLKNDARWVSASDRIVDIFLLLGEGRTFPEVSFQLSLTEKYLYSVRRKVFLMLGLTLCNNAMGTLICRDILYVRRNSSFSQFILKDKNLSLRQN